MDFKFGVFFTDGQRGGWSETYYTTAASFPLADNKIVSLLNDRLLLLDDTMFIDEVRISQLGNSHNTSLSTFTTPQRGLDTGHDVKDIKGNPEVALLLRIEAGPAFRGRIFLRGLKPANYDGENFLPANWGLTFTLFASQLDTNFMMRKGVYDPTHFPGEPRDYQLLPITAIFTRGIVSRKIGMANGTPRGRIMLA